LLYDWFLKNKFLKSKFFEAITVSKVVCLINYYTNSTFPNLQQETIITSIHFRLLKSGILNYRILLFSFGKTFQNCTSFLARPVGMCACMIVSTSPTHTGFTGCCCFYCCRLLGGATLATLWKISLCLDREELVQRCGVLNKTDFGQLCSLSIAIAIITMKS